MRWGASIQGYIRRQDLTMVLGPKMREREQLKLLQSSEEKVKYQFVFM